MTLSVIRGTIVELIRPRGHRPGGGCSRDGELGFKRCATEAREIHHDVVMPSDRARNRFGERIADAKLQIVEPSLYPLDPAGAAAANGRIAGPSSRG